MTSRRMVLGLPDLITEGHIFKGNIESFQLDEPRTWHRSAGGRGDATEPRPRTVSITGQRDEYSPMFFETAMYTKEFPAMTITVLPFDDGSMTSRREYFFSNVVFEGYHAGNSPKGKEPIETLSFDFAVIEVGS